MEYKSLIAKLAIIILLTLSFVNSYNKTSSLVYADSITDEWTSVTTNDELAQAFEYYCKSRNLFIDGTVLGSATKFTTQSFDNICETLGINTSALQANIKKSTDKNGGLQFLFDTNGITAYNRIFAELLQNHDLQEGDTVEEQVVYSGDLVSDADGNTALAYYVETLNTWNNQDNASSITAYGSMYKYNSVQLFSLANTGASSYFNIPYKDNEGEKTVSTRCELIGSNYVWINTNHQNDSYNGGLIYYRYYDKSFFHGYFSIAKYNGNYYVGIFSNYFLTNTLGGSAPQQISNKPNWRYSERFYPVTAQATDVYFTTNNLSINSNTYTDNRQTVINNNGDVNNYDYDNEDPPVNPPSGGGGDTTNVDIDFPNFNFNIPDIDFSLKGLTDKFPFCIPFDMVAFLQLLNAEPQAPRIQGQIPFGSFYTWNLDLDFSRFDDFAVIMRGLEFVGFIFFLISATINIAKG